MNTASANKRGYEEVVIGGQTAPTPLIHSAFQRDTYVLQSILFTHLTWKARMNGILVMLSAIVGVLIFLSLIHWFIYWERRKKKFSPFSEKILRLPGSNLNIRLEEKVDSVLEAAVGLAVTPIAYLLLVSNLNERSAIIFTFITLGAMAFQGKLLLSRTRETASLKLGLDGEVYTGMELNYLMRDGAYVYHDVPYKYGNIDHVIVSAGGVFVVETKAVRKPSDNNGKRQSHVSYRNGHLNFPEFSTRTPILQALRHADHMKSFLKNKTGYDIPITPVVALPGWYIDENDNKQILIINPKRGKSLRSFIQRPLLTEEKVEILSNLIEEIVRSEHAGAEKYNPDASKRFTFWLDRKAEERKLD